MNHLTRLHTIGLLCCLLLSACAPQAPAATLTLLPSDTPVPATDTPIPPTETPVPPTVTSTLSYLEKIMLETKAALTPDPITERLGYACQGEGDLTVIFEAGYGMPGLMDEGITKVIEAIHQSSLEPIRTCRYSRLGLEGSQESRTRQSSKEVVENLHNLILEAHIPGPFILVGHSLGGMFVRHYQVEYPEDIVGIMLVESMQLGQAQRMNAAMLEAGQLFPTLSPAEIAVMQSELIRVSDDQWINILGPLGDLPLVVVTSDKSKGAEPADKVWWEMQDELAALSTRSVHLHSPAGHDVNLEDPAIVVQGLEQLVKMIQATP